MSSSEGIDLLRDLVRNSKRVSDLMSEMVTGQAALNEAVGKVLSNGGKGGRSSRKVREPKPLFSSEFLTFWKAYPRKEGKGRAWGYWKRDKLGQYLSEMLSALPRQIKSEKWRKDGGRFICMPATYLNERRWEDEPIDLSGSEKPKMVADVDSDHPAHGQGEQARWTHAGKQYRLSPRWEMFIETDGQWNFEEQLKGRTE